MASRNTVSIGGRLFVLIILTCSGRSFAQTCDSCVGNPQATLADCGRWVEIPDNEWPQDPYSLPFGPYVSAYAIHMVLAIGGPVAIWNNRIRNLLTRLEMVAARGTTTGKPSEDHIGYIIFGYMIIRDSTGFEQDIGPGDAFGVAPEHDAWVVGSTPCTALDFTHIHK